MYTLIDNNNIASHRVISRHRTRSAAERAERAYLRSQSPATHLCRTEIERDQPRYTVIDTLGRSTQCSNLQEAKRIALRGTGSKRAFLCDWFCVQVGDTDVRATLVWASLADSRNDDSRRAVAEIQRNR